MSLTQNHELLKIMNPSLNSTDSEDKFLKDFEIGSYSSLDRMIRSDLSSYLQSDLLVKADIASMANSLELRSPFLDVNVIEWGISLPNMYKIKGFETKHILKDVARSLVPSKLIDRPKMGFGIPRAEWLRGGLKDMLIDTLNDTTAIQRDWFDNNEVKQVINLHMEGQDRDNILWPMLILELWARTWLD
jgi:asparagine synthase (glutamine-hydrolysing)